MKKIEDVKGLGAWVRQIRKDQGLTQEQLAATCGLGVRFVRELEQEKETCHIGKAIQVMQMLGIEIFTSSHRCSLKLQVGVAPRFQRPD